MENSESPNIPFEEHLNKTLKDLPFPQRRSLLHSFSLERGLNPREKAVIELKKLELWATADNKALNKWAEEEAKNRSGGYFDKQHYLNHGITQRNKAREKIGLPPWPETEEEKAKEISEERKMSLLEELKSKSSEDLWADFLDAEREFLEAEKGEEK